MTVNHVQHASISVIQILVLCMYISHVSTLTLIYPKRSLFNKNKNISEYIITKTIYINTNRNGESFILYFL